MDKELIIRTFVKSVHNEGVDFGKDWYQLDSSMMSRFKQLALDIHLELKPEQIEAGNTLGYAMYEYLQNWVFLTDTPREEIDALKPVKIEGLYFEYQGKKLIPFIIYFGVGDPYTNHRDYGSAYAAYNYGLHSVFKPNGEWLRNKNLRNVCARYDEKTGTLHDWYRE